MTSFSSSFADRLERDLLCNILPFWIEHSRNPTGSFFGEVSCELVANPAAERGVLLTTRILWAFAAAYRAYGEDAYREMLEDAHADLFRLFDDPEHGGFIWSVNAEGSPARTRKQVYGQAFAIYALSEEFLATGNKASLDHARKLFHLLETRARDPEHGGYFEAFARDWSPIEDMRLSEIDRNSPKSQNTMLHVMEAYTNLLRVWPDPAVAAALGAILDLMEEKILDPAKQHLRLFFSTDWQPFDDTVSYGHDIEAAWLMLDAAEVLGEATRLTRFRAHAIRIAEAAIPQLDDDGALLYDGTASGGVKKFHKEWWVQNEAIVGFLRVWKLTGERRFLEITEQIWDFCENHLIDHEGGEWFRATDRDGRPLRSEPKISFWKCPYHNCRAALEACRLLRTGESNEQ